MRILGLLTDGGIRSADSKHYECRHCGANLSSEDADCAECGGEAAVYTF